MEFCWSKRVYSARVLLGVCIAMLSGATCWAAIACPVMLYGGKIDQGTVSVSFMNRGKAPIRELGLSCTALQGQKTKRSDCHTEDGVFFPGTPYTISFPYAGKAPRTMSLSLKIALLSDGVRWTSIHDQPCKSLKITNR